MEVCVRCGDIPREWEKLEGDLCLDCWYLDWLASRGDADRQLHWRRVVTVPVAGGIL
jgi:hypothetical protein